MELGLAAFSQGFSTLAPLTDILKPAVSNAARQHIFLAEQSLDAAEMLPTSFASHSDWGSWLDWEANVVYDLLQPTRKEHFGDGRVW